MADNSPIAGPSVRLELRNGNGRPTVYHVAGSEFLIGSVAGCDLKLSGANLPALVCVLSRQSDGVVVRKLAPTLPLLHNGETFTTKPLESGDLLSLGPMTILVAIEATLPAARPTEVRFEPIPIQAMPSRSPEVNDELAAERRELSKQYQHRRDRLAGLQQAIDTAAKNLQAQKRLVEAERKNVGQIQHAVESRRGEVEKRERYVTDAQEKLARAKLALDEEVQQLDDRKAELEAREKQFVQREEQHREDLARLDRLQGTLEQRERQLESRLADCDRKAEQLKLAEQQADERARAAEQALAQQREQAEQLYKIKLEIDERREKLDERARAVDSQQSMLAALRTRLERTREEVRKEAALFVEQKARQEAAERSLQEQLRQTSATQSNLAAEHQSHAEARRQFDERNAALQAAAAQMRQLQESLNSEAEAQRTRAQELDAQSAELREQAEQIKTRAAQLIDLQQKLEADRNAIEEQGSRVGQTDETRRTLQEQLQRRSEELAAREKQLEDAAKAHVETVAEFGRYHEAFQQVRADVESQYAAIRADLDGRSGDIDRRSGELDEREVTLHRHVEKLRTVGSALAAERKAQHVERLRWTSEQQALLAEVESLRTELEAYRSRTAQESAQLHHQLPDLELRGEAVLARLTQAREELHGHLAELHEYVRQSQDDLQALRSHLHSEFERLRGQELAVQRERTEHRHSVAAFRQNLVEWQARIAEMKRSLVHDGTRLEWKKTEVDAAARQIDAASLQLAQQAAELVAQEQEVQARRGEMERHLEDMREWYRQKLRELAQGRSAVTDEPSAGRGLRIANAEAPSALDELDPGDRQLGELLKTLQLVDDDSLAALWLDAQRQRKSLRQVLLAGRDHGAPLLTLYQMALIESGNLDALVLGRLRVVDRLQVSPHESVFRVFDPQRGCACLLRQLAESDTADSGRNEDFRRCFATAMSIQHANVAATNEVLEINERPAVLQEWLTGLPSNDWPAAAGMPGVWYRLMRQCALGLQAAHDANMIHGHLTLRSVVLTSVGVVKLVGVGDPAWMHESAAGCTVVDDLHALGAMAADWAARAPRRRGNKPPKPLPAALLAVLNRLQPDAADGFASAADLLAALESAGDKLPDSSEAWDELLEHVAENNSEPVAWRKSA